MQEEQLLNPKYFKLKKTKNKTNKPKTFQTNNYSSHSENRKASKESEFTSWI